jgi:hypothetical protein
MTSLTCSCSIFTLSSSSSTSASKSLICSILLPIISLRIISLAGLPQILPPSSILEKI